MIMYTMMAHQHRHHHQASLSTLLYITKQCIIDDHPLSTYIIITTIVI